MNTSSNIPSQSHVRSGQGRRTLLYACVAGTAAALGGGLAWWKARDSGSNDGLPALWSMECDSPVGMPVSMQSFRGKPLLLNFWATWCPPCVDELPLLDAFYTENKAKSWQVLGLAIDQPSSVRTFLKKTPVSFPVGLAGLGGTELGKSLGNIAGGLPFSVLVSATGQVLDRRMGRVSPADLHRWSMLQ